jgi:hypothetical protein
MPIARTRTNVSRTGLLGLAILLMAHGTVPGQDLAAAAAKEKQRRAKAGASGKAYTDADLQQAAEQRAREAPPPADEAEPQPAAVSGEKRPPPPPPSSADDVGDSSAIQAEKRARGREYKARLDALNAQLRQAQKALAAAENDSHMVETHPWALAASLEDVRRRLAAARTRVQDLRDQIDEVETAARREAIPPGYLR